MPRPGSLPKTSPAHKARLAVLRKASRWRTFAYMTPVSARTGTVVVLFAEGPSAVEIDDLDRQIAKMKKAIQKMRSRGSTLLYGISVEASGGLTIKAQVTVDTMDPEADLKVLRQQGFPVQELSSAPVGW